MKCIEFGVVCCKYCKGILLVAFSGHTLVQILDI